MLFNSDFEDDRMLSDFEVPKKIGSKKKSKVSLEWSKLKDIIFVCVSKLCEGRFSTAPPIHSKYNATNPYVAYTNLL